MAGVAFGRRNAVKPTRPLARDMAAPRAVQPESKLDVDPVRWESELRAETPSRAIDPASARKGLAGALVLLLLAVMLPAIYFSELRRDAALEHTYRPDFSVRVERADCSRYFLLVTACSVGFSWHDDNVSKIASSSFLVGFTSMNGLRVVPMRSAADPTVVTSAVALEHLAKRTWTLVLISAACLLLGLLILRKLYRGQV